MISKERQALLDKVKEYEKKEMFDVDVNIDPVTKELLPEDVDYLCKKFKSKIKRKIANFIADKYFLNLIKKDILIIDKIENEELLIDAFKEGAIVTCNHFSPFDNYIVFHSIRKYLPKKYLYKVIREGKEVILKSCRLDSFIESTDNTYSVCKVFISSNTSFTFNNNSLRLSSRRHTSLFGPLP